MTSFLLLIILLTTDCEANDKIQGCQGGWIEFTCKNSQSNSRPQRGDTHRCDVKNGANRVVIEEFKHNSPQRIGCNCEKKFTVSGNDEKKCQKPFNQAAYLNAKTTIKCEYPGEKDNNIVKFLCKDNKILSQCENILSTESHSNQNGTFSLTENESGMNISIRNVSLSHDGVYWCGVEFRDGSYKAARRQIKLTTIDIATFTKSPAVGQNLTYWCKHEKAAQTVFICKGEDPTACQTLITTAKPDMNPRFSMEKRNDKNFTITVREVTASDTGMYWCGAETIDKEKNNQFFHRFLMTVVPTSPPTTSASPTHSTISTIGDHKKISITVSACVVVLLLLLCVIVFIVILKWRSHSKTPPNGGAAPSIREDYVYEEIQERNQSTESGSKINTIYATAQLSTDPSASLHYSTINFQKHSDKHGSEALNLNQKSVCEYSAVKYSKSPTCSTDTEPGRSPQDPLYATLQTVQEC